MCTNDSDIFLKIFQISVFKVTSAINITYFMLIHDFESLENISEIQSKYAAVKKSSCTDNTVQRMHKFHIRGFRFAILFQQILLTTVITLRLTMKIFYCFVT